MPSSLVRPTLQECDANLQMQQSRDCVKKTIARIETKMQENERVLGHVVYMLRSKDPQASGAANCCNVTIRGHRWHSIRAAA